MTSCAIIFDLDGTLSDATHRLHLLKGTDDPDWENFFDLCDQDEVIAATATIYNLLCTQCQMLGQLIMEKKVEADMIFVDVLTGRPEKLRERTLAWFQSHELITPRHLHMRPDDDHRPDNILKIEMYEKLYKGKETVLAVFEDRERVVQAWREAGVTCCQVAEGKY